MRHSQLIERSVQPTAILTDDDRYAAILRRDGAFDGMFFTCVRTTGIYCRPSCSARLPLRRNVVFHESVPAAEQAGFRACKRCRPNAESRDERDAEAVGRACRLIETAEEAPKLEVLAETAGLSSFHFHRVFKRVTGVTPKAYAAACLSRRVTANLESGQSVTSAIFDAGYNASSRFYERAGERLGMTPTAYRKGGVGARIRFAVGECSLGSILVAATERGVCAILFGDDPDMLVQDLEDRFPKADLVGGEADFEATVAAVIALVEAPKRGFDLPLDIAGTAFQEKVWQALRAIPPGKTASYADIASAIGRPAAVRAVAGACAKNALAVAIPCHRVVRSDGALSGYRWGVERKRTLLERERDAP